LAVGGDLGSGISIGRELSTCLGRVFYFKLDSFASYPHKYTVSVRAFLELKTRPRVCPVNRSLYMDMITILLKTLLIMTLNITLIYVTLHVCFLFTVMNKVIYK
jgi:hypothetical protein